MKRFFSAILLISVLFFFGRPASGQGLSVPGGLTRDLVVNPGEKADGRIQVQNPTKKPKLVKAYLTDYLFHSDGRNLYSEAGTNVRSNAPWITFSPKELRLPPGDGAFIDFSIRVPSGILKGTYWSLLMVEGDDWVEGGTKKPPKGIQTVIRFGIQLVTNIGTTGTKQLRFQDKRITRSTGHPVLELDIENTGERFLNPQVWAEFFDQGGKSLGRFPGDKLRLFPGCSARFRIDLAKLPKGKYSTMVIADSGDENVFGAKYSLDLR